MQVLIQENYEWIPTNDEELEGLYPLDNLVKETIGIGPVSSSNLLSEFFISLLYC